MGNFLRKHKTVWIVSLTLLIATILLVIMLVCRNCDECGPAEDDSSSDEKSGETSEEVLSGNPEKMKYEDFCALSGPEKDSYMRSFSSIDDFYDWVVEAQEEFKREYPEAIILGDGSIDLSKYK